MIWKTFRTTRLLDMRRSTIRNDKTYDGSNVCELQVTRDRDCLDQELVFAFGIERGLVLHSLQQNFFLSACHPYKCHTHVILTLDAHMFPRFYTAGVGSNTVAVTN